MKKKFLARAAATLAAAAIPIVGLVAPAYAVNYYPYLKICNSINSVGSILIKDVANSTGGGLIGIGDCRQFYNADDRLRVQPQGLSPYGTDVDSTWWGYEGQGLKYCDPGEGLINPPDYYIGYIKYNTDKSGC